MSSYDKNVYYHPEAHGLTVFAEASPPLSYEYDTFVIWKHEDLGYFTWASDSGCSCPTPFDSALPEQMPQGTLLEAIDDMKSWATDGYGYKPGKELTDRYSRAYCVRQALITLGFEW